MHKLQKWAITLGLASSLAVSATAHADVIATWNQQVVASGGPQTQRTFAMVQVAMFDAINAIEQRYTPYLALPAAPAGASAEAAAAAAAHGVLVRLFPSQQAALDALLAASLAPLAPGVDRDNGVQYGDVVAAAVFNARSNDNMLAAGPVYVTTGAPGDYQLTTPGPPQPVNSNAPNWLPFALESASQFRTNGPPSLTSVRYARDLFEVEMLGGSTSAIRTADQEQLGRWHTEQAQFQFNRIARAETANDGRDLLEHARLFALLNLAMADATTSVFDSKYTYRFWRPSTAIRNADSDGNDSTAGDGTWTPFLTTPPHPEYPAAHGAVQAAGSRVMKDYFGPHHPFTTTSPTVPNVTRVYEDFDAFTAEGMEARVIGGMHFRSSLEEGARQGKRVGNWVLSHYLLPLR